MLKIFRNKLVDKEPLFLLSFIHKQFDEVTTCETDSGRYIEARGFTTAVLRDKEGAVLDDATVFCSELDNFNKAKGRLEALKRLTEGMGREARQLIFESYVDSGAKLG